MSVPLPCEWVSELQMDALGYLERQLLFPTSLIGQVDKLVQDSTAWVRVDYDIYGLQVAALSSPQGGSELLVSIYYEDVKFPLRILLAILPVSLAELQASLASAEYKRRINTAIGRIVNYHRFAYP